jgi:hypothetical protein
MPALHHPPKPAHWFVFGGWVFDITAAAEPGHVASDVSTRKRPVSRPANVADQVLISPDGRLRACQDGLPR